MKIQMKISLLATSVQFICSNLLEITKMYYFSFMHNNVQNSTQVSENNKISGTSISIKCITHSLSVWPGLHFQLQTLGERLL